jgi:citrate lyase beta subunit
MPNQLNYISSYYFHLKKELEEAEDILAKAAATFSSLSL